jgi:hypothetical protein
MAKKSNPIAKIAEKVIHHPDKSEIISKIAIGQPSIDIEEWIKSKYDELNEKQFILSKKDIDTFRDNYFDFYQTISNDLSVVSNNRSTELQLQDDVQGSPAYHRALEKYLDNEIDIKAMAKKMVVNVEARISQMFDIIQEDPRNFKADRTLIEYFNSLAAMLEKYDAILNGSPEQINIQNNINIQVVDKHINVVYDIIREILEKLDYDTSLLFIEMFNERMKSIKSVDELLNQEDRLQEAKILSETTTIK